MVVYSLEGQEIYSYKFPAELYDSGGATFSPDGKQLVFWSNRDTGRRQLWIMNADGKGRQWLFAGTAPDFSADGSRILFVGTGQAALEATEEAVYNSLLRATSVTSRARTAEAIPIERVKAILKKYGR